MDVTYVVLWTVASFAIGVVQARRYEKKNGYTPWNLSMWLWGVIFGVIGLLLGILLFMFAIWQTKRSRGAAGGVAT